MVSEYVKDEAKSYFKNAEKDVREWKACKVYKTKFFLTLSWITHSKNLLRKIRKIEISDPVVLKWFLMCRTKTYSWLARCDVADVVGKKLNVVILPVWVVKYCKQPVGGLH